jgi:hypothetical protein
MEVNLGNRYDLSSHRNRELLNFDGFMFCLGSVPALGTLSAAYWITKVPFESSQATGK